MQFAWVGPARFEEVDMALQTDLPVARRPDRRRWSPAFSLDEAARIRRAMNECPERTECPQCASTMSPMVGGDDAHVVWLLQCRTCLRSLVILDPARHPGVEAESGTGR